jgi:hypothetical protein
MIEREVIRERGYKKRMGGKVVWLIIRGVWEDGLMSMELPRELVVATTNQQSIYQKTY